MLRSRARWVEHGEKSTKYFLNLEKRNYNNKVITKLKTNNGDEIVDPVDILKEEQNIYENLYSTEVTAFTPEQIIEANQYFTSQDKEKSLNDIEIEQCEGEISEKECLENLKAMPDGKTPGTDGLPVESYKIFWNDLKDVLLSCYSHCFRTGQMAQSQRRGIITLIPKKNSSPFLKNLRSIYFSFKHRL